MDTVRQRTAAGVDPLLTVLTAISLLLIPAGCGQRPSAAEIPAPSQLGEAWNGLNNPRRLKTTYQTRLQDLPLAAELSQRPWPDTYWPSNLGGLAQRWYYSPGIDVDINPEHLDAWHYPLASADAVRRLSPTALAALSPAEKYDIFSGNFTYPLTNAERQRTKTNDPGWYGLCDGWASASLGYAEPGPVTLSGANGIAIPFHASDIKALLSLRHRQVRGGRRFAGERCKETNPADTTAPDAGMNTPACRDVNAGSFHIILTNQIALLHKGFVAELSRGPEIWNHPVFGYTARVTARSSTVYPGAAPGTTEIATVASIVRFRVESSPSGDRLDAPPLPPPPGMPPPGDMFISERTYDYTLELNDRGEIIGGDWLSEDRPDFLWTQQAPVFNGLYAGILTLYKASTAP